MLLTEEEAKKKWCPMVRLALATIKGDKQAVSDDGSFNKIFNTDTKETSFPSSTTCEASQCMMWRWREEEREFLGAEIPKTKPSYWDSSMNQYFRFTGKFIRGYCGLGGKP